MPCPIAEANRIDRYCITKEHADDEDYNPCETCTWNLLNSRCGDFEADRIEEAYQRFKDREAERLETI